MNAGLVTALPRVTLPRAKSPRFIELETAYQIDELEDANQLSSLRSYGFDTVYYFISPRRPTRSLDHLNGLMEAILLPIWGKPCMNPRKQAGVIVHPFRQTPYTFVYGDAYIFGEQEHDRDVQLIFFPDFSIAEKAYNAVTQPRSALFRHAPVLMSFRRDFLST